MKMQNELLEEVVIPVGIISALAIAVFIILRLTVASFYPNVEVFIGDKLIYKGTELCVDVFSSGDTTTVRTSKFVCILPDKSYTSKDVVIRTVE